MSSTDLAPSSCAPLIRTYARSLQGKRAYGERPYHHRDNITLIGAIALTGWIGAMTIDGGTNGDIFRFFIESILVPNLWSGACVVMDNLPAHKVDGIRQLIEDKGARLIYLSPYSPDFNPIENCWSKIKEYLRSLAARSRENLENGITNAMDAVSLKEIRNWFSHCCYCTSRSLKTAIITKMKCAIINLNNMQI
ncbi:IS630 family transposase [Brasilonema bromeliae SPC951]|uniref:IS630 family transposase n=1 Tax=Brasilonema bromeliae SPC951 TaxID=385972 RepID=A0ABX1P7S2_9CYAN|nr:IS630 family transposase [Brasilonema bromeliae SPC951]